MDKRGELRVHQGIAGRVPHHCAARRQQQVLARLVAGLAGDPHQGALGPGRDGHVDVGGHQAAERVGRRRHPVDQHVEAPRRKVGAFILRPTPGRVEADLTAGEAQRLLAGHRRAGGRVEVHVKTADRPRHLDRHPHDLAVRRDPALADDRQDERTLDGRRHPVARHPAERPRPRNLGGDRRVGQRELYIGQRLRADHHQAVGLEAKADLAAEHRATAVVLAKADATDAAAEVVADPHEVLHPAARREHAEVLAQQFTGPTRRDPGLRDAAWCRHARAPHPQRHAGRRVPDRLCGADRPDQRRVGPGRPCRRPVPGHRTPRTNLAAIGQLEPVPDSALGRERHRRRAENAPGEPDSEGVTSVLVSPDKAHIAAVRGSWSTVNRVFLTRF